MPSIIFPLEIEEMILDILGEDDDGHLALKSCSLVCRAFLSICRKHIFGRIVLNGYRSRNLPRTTPHALERLLRETPEIADYIRKLEYTIQDADPICPSIQTADLINPSIQESLKQISKLEFLSVRDVGVLDWRWNSIRPALLHLLHLPTLTHFHVTDIKDFIVSDLISCVNLKYLNIGNHTTVAAENTFPAALPENSIQLNEFVAGFGTSSSSAIMKLFTAYRPDGQPIIDFKSLSKITVEIEEPNEGEASQELFRQCHALTNVKVSLWNLWNPLNFRPSLSDMLKSSMQTLKHVVVIIYDDVNNVDPLFGIPSELEVMRTKNILETITLEIILLMPGVNCSGGNDWGRLDEVLTASGWFSLKRVSLAIEIGGYFEKDDELEVALKALRNVPETQFPRLSSCNSILFDFEIRV